MREILEIRCSTESVFKPYIRSYSSFQKKWLIHDWELTTVIAGSLDDPAFLMFLEYLKEKAGYLVSSIKRTYTKNELLSAELIKVWISATFEPTGEEVGTEYVYPCDICKGGRYPKDRLILNLSKVPKNTDIAKTIANDEWIISEKLASIISDHKITGITTQPVQHSSPRKLKSKWYQMIVTATVNVSELTKYGDAFKPNLDIDTIKTSCGHTINHIALSELYIRRDSWDGSDIAKTNLYFGGHLNLTYPYPYILISQRFYRLLEDIKIKRYTEEIAHFVP